MLKSIIEALKARIEALETQIQKMESEIKNVKWVASENLKIMEYNENLINKMAKLIDGQANPSKKLLRIPITEKPSNGSHE